MMIMVKSQHRNILHCHLMMGVNVGVNVNHVICVYFCFASLMHDAFLFVRVFVFNVAHVYVFVFDVAHVYVFVCVCVCVLISSQSGAYGWQREAKTAHLGPTTIISATEIRKQKSTKAL